MPHRVRQRGSAKPLIMTCLPDSDAENGCNPPPGIGWQASHYQRFRRGWDARPGRSPNAPGPAARPIAVGHTPRLRSSYGAGVTGAKRPECTGGGQVQLHPAPGHVPFSPAHLIPATARLSRLAPPLTLHRGDCLLPTSPLLRAGDGLTPLRYASGESGHLPSSQVLILSHARMADGSVRAAWKFARLYAVGVDWGGCSHWVKDCVLRLLLLRGMLFGILPQQR